MHVWENQDSMVHTLAIPWHLKQCRPQCEVESWNINSRLGMCFWNVDVLSWTMKTIASFQCSKNQLEDLFTWWGKIAIFGNGWYPLIYCFDSRRIWIGEWHNQVNMKLYMLVYIYTHIYIYIVCVYVGVSGGGIHVNPHSLGLQRRMSAHSAFWQYWRSSKLQQSCLFHHSTGIRVVCVAFYIGIMDWIQILIPVYKRS